MNLEPLRELERKWRAESIRRDESAFELEIEEPESAVWNHGVSAGMDECADDLSRALAQLDDGWRPIAEAKKSDVLLGVAKDGIIRLISWHHHRDFQCWAYMGLGGWFKHNPTHFRPLPSQPAQEDAT